MAQILPRLVRVVVYFVRVRVVFDNFLEKITNRYICMSINYPISSSETSHPRRKVNNKTTRIINNIWLKKPMAPYSEGPNCVAKSEPQWHKEHPCIEVHPPK